MDELSMISNGSPILEQKYNCLSKNKPLKVFAKLDKNIQMFYWRQCLQEFFIEFTEFTELTEFIEFAENRQSD